jgi:SAM-dependent methyltransferase
MRGGQQVIERIVGSLRSAGPRATAELIWKNLTYELRWYLDGRFDRRYGTKTSGVIELAELEISSQNVEHGVYYEATPTRVFRRIVRCLPFAPSHFVFCDLGCGLGRALLLASDLPFRRIIGVEFSEALHQRAVENVKVYRSKRQRCFSIEALLGDAAEYSFPPEPLVVFFYNPFREPVMSRVLENLAHSVAAKPRRVVIAYYNPLLGHLVEGFGFLPHQREVRLPYEYTRVVQRRAMLYYNEQYPRASDA